jgi:glycosyltransferase involved in cell wall biosynthesis
LLGLGSLANRVLPATPILRHLAISVVVVLRPVLADPSDAPASVSVLIPARNERGNIEPAVRRLPDLGGETEIIFVEGHSSDGTWEEIERVAASYDGPHRIVTLQQTGKGKADAVRLGFAHATGDLLTILDADLTMPPELLPRFVDAYRKGLADFVNGSRIVYPMEGEAMRPLNRLGNVFFAKALTSVLGTRLGDSLCGTKLVRRDDYARMTRWREDFGDFDPFGDFELIFPAATLGLGIVDVPIRYAARTYGSTQISRFRHGLLLLKMTTIGFFRVKLGSVPGRR